MGKEWNINKMACVILLFFMGLLCIFSVKAETVFIPGGVFTANNGGEPLPFSNSGGINLNYVESANFKTKYIKQYNMSTYNVVCVDNIRNYFSTNTTAPNPSIVDVHLRNESGERIAIISQSSNNQRTVANSEPINAEITTSFSHVMTLKMYSIYRPFKSIPDIEYECAAYPIAIRLSNIKEITYYTMRMTDLFTVAVPSISIDRTSLNLGDCQAGTSGTLNGSLLINLNYEGDHRRSKGSLTATVVGDTNDLSIRTAAGYNLVGTQPLEIGETAIGDYPLTVSVPCPNWAGTYQWRATLTYTIE